MPDISIHTSSTTEILQSTWSSVSSPYAIWTTLLVLCTSLLTAFVCHKIFVNRTKRILREAKSHWNAKQCSDNNCSLLIESIPSGWFNILLTSIWPSLLERFFSNIATERLEKSFERRIKFHRRKFPWRHLKQVDVEHVTLGLTPPQFQIILAKFDPLKQSLVLEADTKWTTSAFQIVLCPVIRSPLLSHLKTRFLLSNLDISGRICINLELSPDQPGVKCCEISFCEVPRIDMRITPLGVTLKDFPGIPESLRATIVKLLTKGMVHPKKLSIDLRRIYDIQRMKQRGGKGGLLTITISSAHEFSDSNSTVEAYCECEFETHTFRTPIRSGRESIEWNWNCGIRLNEMITTKLDRLLKIRIFNSKSLGEPTLLAHGSVSLRDVGLSELRAGIVSTSVELQSTIGKRRPIVDLCLQLTEPEHDPPLCKSKSESDLRSCMSELPPSTVPQERLEDLKACQMGRSPSMPLLNQMQNEVTQSNSVYQEKVEAIEDALTKLHRRRDGMDSDPVNLETSQTSSSESVALFPSASELATMFFDATKGSCSTDSALQEAGRQSPESSRSTGFMNLLHVTKFDDALRRDRLIYQHKLSEMQSHVSQLENQLAKEHNRRLDEGHRSLLEGGRFIVHKPHERAVRYVWYDSTERVLNWGRQKVPVKSPTAQMWQIKSQPLDQISEIRAGIDYFPKANVFGLNALRNFMQRKIGGNTQIDPDPVSDKCFSILFMHNKALNLEIPTEGNGRSRDAWVEALQSLTKD